MTLDMHFQDNDEDILQFGSSCEQIISGMPVGVMVVDAALGIQSINPIMRGMFGCADAGMQPGTSLFAVVPSRELCDSLLQATATGVCCRNLIITLPDRDGVRYIEFGISTALFAERKILLLMAQEITERMRSQEELRRFRMALDSSIDAVYLIDHARMRFIDVNETASATMGYSYQELLQLGPQDLKPNSGELERIRRWFDQVIRSESKTEMMRTVLQRKDGSQLPVEIHLRAVQSEGRQLLVAVARDITSRLRAEAELRESEERFRVGFNQAAVGLVHVSPEGRILIANRKLCEIGGYSQQELLNLHYQELIHPDDLPVDLEIGRRMLAREVQEQACEKRYRRKDGRYIWVNLTSSLVWDADGRPKYFSTVVEDISRRKQVEGELRHLVNHDALTGLPNRTLLLDRLSQAIAYANRLGADVAVMLIDLDRFKDINDSLGHEVGDCILLEIGRRLAAQIHDGDTVAHLGGDEFAVLMGDVTREEAVANLAHRMLAAISQPMTIQGHEIYPAGSIGISLYPKDGQDGTALLKNADTAMYRAKEAGRNNFQFYAQEMNARALDRLKLDGGLRRALSKGEFLLHYQPQMDIVSGRIVGMEALVRWQPPGQAMIFPGDFISIAEETGLIVPIGEWVLRTACAQYKEWQAMGLDERVRIAVNLSARQFQQQNLVKTIADILRQTGCKPSCLELEITESVVMEHPEAAAATLRQLSDMGVSLAIDDFGTGYSSLSYLKRFPIDALKIDRSFVRDIATDPDDAAIAKAVIALAHSMRLIVVAEGVETTEQLDFLREQRCDRVQGYHLSRPLSVEQCERLLGL